MRVRWIGVGSLVLLASAAWAGETITLDRPELYDLQHVGLEATKATEVRIEAIGMWQPDGRSWVERLWRDVGDGPMSVFAWLLDADTRRPVWVMKLDDTERESRYLWRTEQSLRLEPGRYELYLFSDHLRAARRLEQAGGRDDADWWQRMFSGDRSIEDVRDDLERCHVSVDGDDLRRVDVGSASDDSLIELAGLGDSDLVAKGFALDAPARLRVYSVFEWVEDARSAADYGWILDEKTREVVWQPRETDTRPAGGSEKNRLIDEELELPAGRYLVFFGTDDSHSLDGFNATAPLDPLRWGITLWPGDGFDPSSFSVFDPVETQSWVELTRMGDDASRQRKLGVEREARLWIRALGEYDPDDGEFYDHGWITELETGDVVWEMTAANTRGAGGAEKNRLFDGVVTLGPGRYVLHFVTDGSHSFSGWNAARPFDPAAWGIRVSPAPGTDPAAVTLLDETDVERSSGVLVR